MTDPLVLLGRLVTFDAQRPVIESGALYIGADERIAAVQNASDPAPADGMNLFWSLVHLHGGPTPVRRFLPELIDLISPSSFGL